MGKTRVADPSSDKNKSYALVAGHAMQHMKGQRRQKPSKGHVNRKRQTPSANHSSSKSEQLTPCLGKETSNAESEITTASIKCNQNLSALSEPNTDTRHSDSLAQSSSKHSCGRTSSCKSKSKCGSGR